MDTDGIETKKRTRQICVHPWNPWLKQLRPTDFVEEPNLLMPDRNFETSIFSEKDRFATTHWSVIVGAGDPASPDVDASLEKLS
jgi:hypothetical protein